MSDQITEPSVVTEQLLSSLAREIAMDIHDIQTILETHNINRDQWTRIQTNPVFTAYLRNEVANWNGAINTHERVKLKASAMIEAWLPELNARLHDRTEALNSKIEGGKLAARIAGMGLNNIDGVNSAEKFSVVINLGNDRELKFEKTLTIEHDKEM